MKNEKCFFLATIWDTHYELEKDDGEGNVPKEINPMGSYYEVIFTHGKMTVRVHGVAYAKFCKQKKTQKPDKLSFVN